jgi:hypothetical protein
VYHVFCQSTRGDHYTEHIVAFYLGWKPDIDKMLGEKMHTICDAEIRSNVNAGPLTYEERPRSIRTHEELPGWMTMRRRMYREETCEVCANALSKDLGLPDKQELPPNPDWGEMTDASDLADKSDWGKTTD